MMDGGLLPIGGRMEQDLEQTIALLSRTPIGLDGLLRGLPESWTHRGEGESTWTVFDVVGHLIYADRENWLPRARRILQLGEGQPFDSFDRLGHVKESQGKSLSQLLDEFAAVREGCLNDLRALSLQPQQMIKRGRHPALGPVTLSELLATWVAHDMTHLHQISR